MGCKMDIKMDSIMATLVGTGLGALLGGVYAKYDKGYPEPKKRILDGILAGSGIGGGLGYLAYANTSGEPQNNFATIMSLTGIGGGLGRYLGRRYLSHPRGDDIGGLAGRGLGMSTDIVHQVHM